MKTKKHLNKAAVVEAFQDAGWSIGFQLKNARPAEVAAGEGLVCFDCYALKVAMFLKLYRMHSIGD